MSKTDEAAPNDALQNEALRNEVQSFGFLSSAERDVEIFERQVMGMASINLNTINQSNYELCPSENEIEQLSEDMSKQDKERALRRSTAFQAVRDDFLSTLVPIKSDVQLRELSWVFDLNADGKERLTIWFTQNNNDWRQVGFRKWQMPD